MLLKPTIVLNSVLDIDKSLLEKNNIKALILDLDNTLATHGNPNPAKGIDKWVKQMKQDGVKLIIVSNNNKKRVKPFADKLEVDFVSEGKKPLCVGFKKARAKLNFEFNQIAIVGDQIFTDVLGANICRAKTIFVFPFEAEVGLLFTLKRIVEKPFLPKRGKI